MDGHFLSTFGLLIFAINGAELATPYVKEMKDGKRDFPDHDDAPLDDRFLNRLWVILISSVLQCPSFTI